MAMQASEIKKALEISEQQRVEKWFYEVDVTTVTRAAVGNLTTSLARVGLVDGAEGGVVESVGDGHVLGVEEVGSGDPLHAHPPDLLRRVEAELHGAHHRRRRLFGSHRRSVGRSERERKRARVLVKRKRRRWQLGF